MENQDRESLRELFGRFLEPGEAERAAEEVWQTEKLIERYPAPAPGVQMLADIKRRMNDAFTRRHRLTRVAHRILAAAAVIVVVALVGLLGRRPTSPADVSYASLIPTAIWDSDDINSDDVELAYFTAEIDRIEAQIHLRSPFWEAP